MNTAYAEKLLQWLLSEEDCESDDRRFYCSYLIAHSSLSMADAADDDNFFSIMKGSLIDALEQDTLSEQDKLGIHSLWDEAQHSNG